jgi:hypothetical protein
VEIQPAGPAKALTLSQASKLLQLCRGNIRRLSGKQNERVDLADHPYNEFFSLNFELYLAVASPAAVTPDRERDHYEHGHEHDDDGDLQRRKQEANQQDQLFQKRNHHEDQSNDCSESAKTF